MIGLDPGLRHQERTRAVTATDLPADAAPADRAEPESIRRMMASAREASEYLKAFAHENRLIFLCLLAERERSVTELEEALALRQPSVSQQLARLRLDGLVRTRREGKTVYYSLADDDVRRFIKLIHDKFCPT
jgi:DNA-binding transcriptional ArsR family regulator